ncbi:hypothetical protein ACW7EJ_20495, partial [Acinetobacter soli]
MQQVTKDRKARHGNSRWWVQPHRRHPFRAPMTGATSSVAFGAVVGVSGAMVSTVKSIAGLLPLSFPALSVAV